MWVLLVDLVGWPVNPVETHHQDCLHGSQQEGWYLTPMLANCTLMMASADHATMWSIIGAGLHLHQLQGCQTWDSITRYFEALIKRPLISWTRLLTNYGSVLLLCSQCRTIWLSDHRKTWRLGKIFVKEFWRKAARFSPSFSAMSSDLGRESLFSGAMHVFAITKVIWLPCM